MNKTQESIDKSVKKTEETMRNIRHDPYLHERCSWKVAYGISGIFHLVIIGIVAVCLLFVAHEQKKETYVIDMTISETLESGGSAPGGGGGGQLFPKALSKEEVSSRIKEVQKAAADPNAVTKNVTDHVQDASDTTGTHAGDTTGNHQIGGNGGPGSGTGTGIGHGDGDGKGEGRGKGGKGNGTGEGEGDGDAPFDIGGFIAKIQSIAQETYPPLAQKKGMQGVVYVTVTLDANGNYVDGSVSGSSGHAILDKHALRKVQEACPYPNDSRKTQTVQIPVHYTLQ